MPALLGGTGIIGKDIFVKMKAQKSASIQTASGTVVTFPQAEERAFSGLSIYGHSTQSGTPSPENPVPIVSAGDEGEINILVSDGGTQLQTLTLSTPGGLPGIPVSSGGNYTDENGQQWICDEIDLARGKCVHRVEKVELDGTEAFELVQGVESGQPFFLLQNSINIGQSTLKGYSNYFPVVSITIRGKEQGIGGWATDLYLRWTELFSAVEDLKTFLSEKYASGIPVTAYYILETPIETDLTAEEIAAYQALHTYSPTTTVSNDADAWMKVEYNEFKKQTF